MSTGTLFGRAMAVATLGMALHGCERGPAVYHLAGQVTYEGKPVPAGTIIFEPDAAQGNKGPAGMAKILAGAYDTRLPPGRGTISGPHVVRITGIERVEGGRDGGEVAVGRPLFENWSAAEDLPAADGTRDFVIDEKPTPINGRSRGEVK